ncbi:MULTISPECIES: sigma-70 family RNA polymerase sigma factor [Streptomyces]|uniref:RNA polymerase sigma factor 70 region 4 type 2 domain-containing protein n=1 Tax=Streptomyces luteosporeus TaxID=173856 RepID=A0ABP6GK88_9ACTN
MTGDRRSRLEDGRLPLDFQAFYLGVEEMYHSYATEILGNREDAEEAVHEAFCLIRDEWADLLSSSNVEEGAWSVLRLATMRRLRSGSGRPAFVAKGAFARAMDAAGDQLAVLEESIGLYAAIAELPNRQFDVIVLQYVIGYPVTRTAWLLGLDERTVDYHGRKGKEYLRRQLGIPEVTRIKEVRK